MRRWTEELNVRETLEEDRTCYELEMKDRRVLKGPGIFLEQSRGLKLLY